MTFLFRIFWRLRGIHIAPFVRIGFGIFSGNLNYITLGKGVGIGFGFQIIASKQAHIQIGKGTCINRFFTCGAIKDITIGQDCLMSYNRHKIIPSP